LTNALLPAGSPAWVIAVSTRPTIDEREYWLIRYGCFHCEAPWVYFGECAYEDFEHFDTCLVPVVIAAEAACVG